MTEPASDSMLKEVARNAVPGGVLIGSWELSGGVSRRTTALDVRRPDGAITQLVLRQYPGAELLGDEELPAREFRLLRLLEGAGLHASAPVCMDVSGAFLSSPYLVLERIDGETEFTPTDRKAAVRGLAACLSRIHAHEFGPNDHPFLRSQSELAGRFVERHPAGADEIDFSGRAWIALQKTRALPQRNADVLLHGDFWPGNVLWKEGRITGVIDWEDAAFGDPLADLANTRLEMMWAFGEEAMHDLTSHYQRISSVDLTDLHFWDLYSAFRKAHLMAAWGLAPQVRNSMLQQLRRFVEAACDGSRQQP